MRRTALAAALLWLTSAGVSSVMADTARIAGWNLGGFNAIPAAKLDQIVAGLEFLDADIVVLSELNPLAHAEAIAARLSAPGGPCYKSAAPDQPLARQEIGFVFKCDVTVSFTGLVIGSDLEKQGYRNGAVVHAAVGNFDFVLVGLHLKAGRTASDRALRSEQLKIISGFTQGVLAGGEKDVLIVGDYNMIPGVDDANFATLNADGALRCVSSEDLAGTFSHIGTNGPGELLDGFCITTVDAAEYDDGSVAIVPLHEQMGLTLGQFRSQVTDHLPILATFTIDTDHD